MESQIWRVQTEKIGSLEPFKSERDMESFLMNNPAIVGCWNPESNVALPTLIRQQVGTKTGSRGIGRIDLIGISIIESDYELRIFELKAGDIYVAAVEQLDSYLKGWEHKESAKAEIRNWILSLNLEGIVEGNVDKIINRPVGVLVGSRFQPEAISKAMELNIQGIRLARFRSETKSEYFVIVEDQVGKIVETGKRQWSWNDLVRAGLMDPSDDFSISHKGIKLLANADQKYFDYIASKRVIFKDEAVNIIKKKEKEIKKNAPESEKKWIDIAIESVKIGESLPLTKATGLCFYAFGGPTASFWVPTSWWIHEKSGKSLEQLKNELFG
ncbi:MAG: hypothetical protein U9O41_04735 [Candidatus Aerophobetes bacterium]|nr:hypothetical protein [Candidatus Aerophobetes bacterium]